MHPYSIEELTPRHFSKKTPAISRNIPTISTHQSQSDRNPYETSKKYQSQSVIYSYMYYIYRIFSRAISPGHLCHTHRTHIWCCYFVCASIRCEQHTFGDRSLRLWAPTYRCVVHARLAFVCVCTRDSNLV